MPRKKFDIGDVVFYKTIENGETYISEMYIIVSEQDAHQLYTRRYKHSNNIKNIKEDNPTCKPVFIVPIDDLEDIDWMPKSKLFPANKAMQVLYGKNNG